MFPFLSNLQNLINLGVNHIDFSINPKVEKKFTLKSFELVGSPVVPMHMALHAIPLQVAIGFEIPLIIWGAHQGIDQVGMFSHNDKVEMNEKYRKNHDLMGYDANDLVGEICDQDDLVNYQYPSMNDLEKVGVRGIYLNNYMFWDSFKQHVDMHKKYNYNFNILQSHTPIIYRIIFWNDLCS